MPGRESSRKIFKEGCMQQQTQEEVLLPLSASAVVTVSAQSGGNAERVLQAIVAGVNARIPLQLPHDCLFEEWHFEPLSKLSECRGQICAPEKPPVPVVFTIGGRGEMSLLDFHGTEWYPKGAKRGYVICIGSGIDKALIPVIAHQLVLWIANMR
jgi:hypothetical protein